MHSLLKVLTFDKHVDEKLDNFEIPVVKQVSHYFSVNY